MWGLNRDSPAFSGKSGTVPILIKALFSLWQASEGFDGGHLEGPPPEIPSLKSGG